jgi:hypothetical protein
MAMPWFINFIVDILVECDQSVVARLVNRVTGELLTS